MGYKEDSELFDEISGFRKKERKETIKIILIVCAIAAVLFLIIHFGV